MGLRWHTLSPDGARGEIRLIYGVLPKFLDMHMSMQPPVARLTAERRRRAGGSLAGSVAMFTCSEAAMITSKNSTGELLSVAHWHSGESEQRCLSRKRGALRLKCG